MIEDSQSLILGNGQQLSLLDAQLDDAGLPPEAYEQSESFGRFTGDRIFSTNPRIYNAIAALLARGMPYREVSEICGVSVNTVCAISVREGTPIETIRERIGRLGLDVAQLSIEAMRDLLADPVLRGKLAFRDLAIAYGIATQNAQLLLGGATARIETMEAAPTHEAYLAYLAALRNVTPARTGLSAETPDQKSEPAALPAAAVIDLPDATSSERTNLPSN